MHTVYLAGPITGLTFDECTDWREYAIKELANAGIKGLSPMRCKESLKAFGKLSATCEAYDGKHGVMSTSRGIMTRDRFDALRCDVLLVNLLGSTQISIGTCFEFAWANSKGTPIVCAIEPKGNPHEHVMVQEAIGFRLPTPEEAIAVVKSILV